MRVFVLALFTTLLSPPAAHAWGPLGHRVVSEKAIDALPEGLRKIMRPQANWTFIEDHAMDADLVRETDTEETLRHFIYLDRYEKSANPYAALPLSLGQMERKFGKATVRANGTLPWVIENHYNALLKAFKEKNRTKIWTEAAWLGHYVADAHVPLHTATGEGAAGGGGAALTRWENSLLDRMLKPDEIEAEAAMVFTRAPLDLAREWTLESYRLVEPMLNADRQSFRNGEMDYELFGPLALPTVRQRLAQAAHRVASMWYTAWEKAGRPTKIPGLPQPEEPKRRTDR